MAASRSLRIVARVHGYPNATNAGAEWMLHPMLAALAARSHTAEVHLSQPYPMQHPQAADGTMVYRPGPAPGWELDGVHVYQPGAWPPLRPDAYVTHLENVRAATAAARGRGVPLIVLMHNTRPITRNDLAYADPALTVLNSEWMAAELGRPGRSVIVRPPVHAAVYETAPGDKVTLVNLTTGKGGPLFWQVVAAMPDVEFLAVQGSYGEQVIPDGGLPNVTVVENVDGRQMRDEVYARTRILMVPSDYESWGRVATEAMCSGIPVIANRAEGGLAENLGEAAIWADRDDPGTWVRQIERLQKPAAWEKASEACRKRFAELDPAADLERWCDAVEGLVP